MKMSLLAAVLCLSACGPETDTPADTDKDPRVQNVVDYLQTVADDGASGIVRITHAGEVLLEFGFGSASCSVDEPVTPDHVFMIGSITKEFTRVLAYVLEEKGFFSLGNTVAEIVPGFDGPIGDVTLQQLLDHTGGLPDLIDRNGDSVPYTVEYDYEPVSRTELLDRAAKAELLWEPEHDEQYSNLGYQLLAAIYEVATEESYPALPRRFIYEPAGMRHTDFWFSDAGKRAFVDGCRSADVHWGNPIDEAMWGEEGPSWNLKGAGGLMSTAESLSHFFAAIGSGAFFESAEQTEKYKSSRLVQSESRQQRVMGPAGSNGIFNSVAYWADGDKFSLIVMTNRADHFAEDGIFRAVLNAFPQGSFEPRGD